MPNTSPSDSPEVSIVEVGPRDGFQSITPFIPTDTKQDIVRLLSECGLRRMEVTSFVSQAALRQMRDAPELLSFAQAIPGLDCQVLVPSLRHAGRALSAGAKRLSFVVSVSEAHNQGNVRRSPAESVGEYAQIVAQLPIDASIRINIATAFDCPHTGLVAIRDVLSLLDKVVPVLPAAEFAICDTTGRATPKHVTALFNALQCEFASHLHWSFHAHDTYGLGAANVWAAWTAGVRTFDGAIAGMGGCPFAPGASGNVATEDLVWLFERSGISTGIDLDRLVATALQMKNLPGVQLGGRVRSAHASRSVVLSV